LSRDRAHRHEHTREPAAQTGGKVFTDLAISSRSQLDRVLPADPETGQPQQPSRRPGSALPRPGLATGTVRLADTSATLPHDDRRSKQSRTGKHRAGKAMRRVRRLAAGAESEDHSEYDQYI
jgi:hypothetical protein